MLLSIFGAILLFFFLDGRFYVASVALSGNKLVSAEEIRQAAHLRSWSIFYVNTQQVAEAVRKSFPCVRAVNVRCRLPARVIVEMQEREAQAVWEAKNGRYLVDKEGFVLKAAQAGQDMPLIRDQGDQMLKPGDKDKVNKLAVQAARHLYELISEARVFDYIPDKGIALTDPNGWPIYFGTEGDMSVKVANLEALRREIQRLGVKVEYVDLRFEQAPLYREARRP